MTTSNRRMLVQTGPLISLLLALPLLRLAARHDRHWRTNTNAVVDHRVGAGLFLACGLAAAAPALVTAVCGQRRGAAILVTIVILAVSVLCEGVVSAAPEPWFTF
jgi:hypothetical protein